ncbi:hypothetical protein RRF57_003682 [Xylaria bambusicola]|uniref:Uncharacterized protein n=1 Tax=Xylaria bambusicola TaxID=326684 RepID=A0AAN7Z3N3_9PEZI
MANAPATRTLTIRLDQYDLDVEGGTHNIRNLLFDYLQFSQTCLANRDRADTPTAVSPSEDTIELRPVFVPAEIFLNIIKYIEEPYKLQGGVSVHGDLCIRLLKPRTWADIIALKICYATRAQAIRQYGRPMPDSVPFDGSIDSICLRTLGADEMGMWYEKPSKLDYHLSSTKGTQQDGCKPLDVNFLTKLKCAEIQLDNYAQSVGPFEVMDWVEAHLAGPNGIRMLRLNLWQYDNCKSLSLSMKYEHLCVVYCLLKKREFLKSLEIIEVEIQEAVCSKNMKLM